MYMYLVVVVLVNVYSFDMLCIFRYYILLKWRNIYIDIYSYYIVSVF